jgi:hypothetical protein
MAQRVVIDRQYEAISKAVAKRMNIVSPDELEDLSSITKVGHGGYGTVYALRFKSGTVPDGHHFNILPNHVKPSFALIYLTSYASVLLGR